MNHDHSQQGICPYCKPHKPGESLTNKGMREKLLSFLGVGGCVSCYVAMFPAILLGIVGILGLSISSAGGVLNAYMNSALFQPILIFSILFLIIGLIRHGNAPLFLAIISGIGIFVSMNFYMRAWLFTLSFGILALAYFFAYRKSKSMQLKTVVILISAVVVLGIIDIGRTVFSSPNSQNNSAPQRQTPPSMRQMQ